MILPKELQKFLLDFKEQWTTTDVCLYYDIEPHTARIRMKQVKHNNKVHPMVCDSKELKALIAADYTTGLQQVKQQEISKTYLS